MQDLLQKFKPRGRQLWLLIIILFVILPVSGAGIKAAFFSGISEKTRVAACADTLQAINGATGTIFAMSFAGKSEVEMQEYMDSIFAGVAQKHGLKPEQIDGICEQPK